MAGTNVARVKNFNNLGQVVLVLYNGYHPGGLIRIPLDVSGLSSGFYFYLLDVEYNKACGKIILDN